MLFQNQVLNGSDGERFDLKDRVESLAVRVVSDSFIDFGRWTERIHDTCYGCMGNR